MDHDNAIDPAHYNGLRHTVVCHIGPEYTAKEKAYRDDGFFCQTPRLIDGMVNFQVCKPMPGEDW